MKKAVTYIFFSMFALGSTTGQEYDTNNEIGLSIGQSTINLLLNRVFNDDALKYDFSGGAVAGLQYDRTVNKWLSVGLAYSRQSMDVQFDEYVDNNGILQEGDFNADLTRNVVQLRAFAFYQANQWRFRAGPRIGVSFWDAAADAGNRDLRFIDRVSNTVLPGIGFLILGINYRPIHSLSFGTELNLFSPYILGVNVLYHF